ncbi:thiamine pyrophosphate-binding protein [Leucobacter sp.]
MSTVRPSSAPSVSELAASELARAASVAFGVLGNGNAHFVDALVAAGVPFTPTRHEAGAVGAADGFARAAGELAIATTTYGPGFANALTPLAEAAAARSPLLLVTGAPPTPPRPWDIDQSACVRAVGALSVTLTAANTGNEIRRAVETARSERRPVVIEIPYDIATRPADTGVPRNGRTPGPLAEHRSAAAVRVAGAAGSGDADGGSASATDRPHDVAEAAQILTAAERPLIVAGRGALLAGMIGELRELAEALGAPTATTAVARGAFGSGLPSLGVVGGFADEESAGLIASADAVLVVGAGLNPFSTRFGRAFGSARVIRIDLDPGPTQAPIERTLRGDAADLVPALRSAVRAIGAGPSGWAATLGTASPPAPERPASELAQDGRLDPRAIAIRLEEILPARRRLVQDIGHSISWAPRYLSPDPSLPPLFMGSAFQSTGLGLLGAIGACAASRGELVLAATGDGSALMALADLDTLARSRTRCVVLVWNDAAYNAEVIQYANAQGLAAEPMLIEEVDFAAAARAVGAAGSTIRTLADLAGFAAWLDGGSGLYVLDCRVSRLIEAPFMGEITASVVAHDAGESR